MKPETTAQRIAREAKLKNLCEDLGLKVDGSIVTVPLGNKPVEVDASIINFDQLVPCLMYLAYQKGAVDGRQDVFKEIKDFANGLNAE
ncbi:hypothetical protein [Sulfitobacter sp. R18_1]|uniref:hypothetical protein n=1 Tax=Sulfitobacter sp. R18_1 TaxID=2821104 RepID=UPI001AD98FFC|nr:hypothetical protein [Sulfitobacter sp. R18_1]MBO9428240.1 hypothetical protein [Sulfitobacter sp. R18_1]